MTYDPVLTGLLVTAGSLLLITGLTVYGALIYNSGPLRRGDTEPPEDHLNEGDEE